MRTFLRCRCSCLCAKCDENMSHDLNMGTCWVYQTPVHQESCALGGQQLKARQFSSWACLYCCKGCSSPIKATARTYGKFTVRWEHDLM